MKRIHVNQQVIRHNKKYGNNLPPLRVEEGTKTVYCREVEILGPSKLVYRPDMPLPCGAKLWIETDAQTYMVEPCAYADLSADMKDVIAGIIK